MEKIKEKIKNIIEITKARSDEHKKLIAELHERISLVEAQEKDPNLLPFKPKYYDGTIKKKRLYYNIETQYQLMFNLPINAIFDIEQLLKGLKWIYQCQ